MYLCYSVEKANYYSILIDLISRIFRNILSVHNKGFLYLYFCIFYSNYYSTLKIVYLGFYCVITRDYNMIIRICEIFFQSENRIKSSLFLEIFNRHVFVLCWCESNQKNLAKGFLHNKRIKLNKGNHMVLQYVTSNIIK